MITLAPSPHALDAYLRHTVDGLSLNEAAQRCGGVERSTVLRRARMIEDLRDNLEWDEILNTLELDRLGFAEPPRATIGPDTVARALGVDIARVAANVAHIRRVMMGNSGAVIVTAPGASTARIFHNGDFIPNEGLRRPDLLAALVFGWIKSAGAQGKAHRYGLTDAAALASQILATPAVSDDDRRFLVASAESCATLEWAMRRCPDYFGPSAFTAVREFQLMHINRAGSDMDSYSRLESSLPPRLFSVLRMICGDGRGFEFTEKALGIPGRSAKIILSIALESFGYRERWT